MPAEIKFTTKDDERIVSVCDWSERYGDFYLSIYDKDKPEKARAVFIDANTAQAIAAILSGKPEFTPAPSPGVGAYIEVTTRGDRTLTGEVTGVRDYDRYVNVTLASENDFLHELYIDQEPDVMQTKDDIVEWREVERPVKIVEVGEYLVRKVGDTYRAWAATNRVGAEANTISLTSARTEEEATTLMREYVAAPHMEKYIAPLAAILAVMTKNEED